MARIKWNTHDVSFRRGNYQDLIVKLNNCKVWLGYRAVCSTSTFKTQVRRLAQAYGATEVEIKDAWMETEEGKYVSSEKRVIGWLNLGNGEFIFSYDLPVPEGSKRIINYVRPEEIFI